MPTNLMAAGGRACLGYRPDDPRSANALPRRNRLGRRCVHAVHSLRSQVLLSQRRIHTRRGSTTVPKTALTGRELSAATRPTAASTETTKPQTVVTSTADHPKA